MEAIKFPEKLQPLFTPMRYKVAYGGRGGAKSWSFARALLLIGVQRPIRILCCREFQKSIKDSVLTLLSDQIRGLGLESYYQILHNEIRGSNGTQINFEGLSQNVMGIKSYEGVDYVWVEEGNSVTKRSWDILIPTIRKDGSEIWVSFNPELEDDYAYDRWVVGEDPRAEVIEINWRDNPWFTGELNEERIAWKLRDPDGYEHVWEGKPRKWLEGAIYARQFRKAFEEERITCVPHDPEVRVFTAWDIGRTDDTAIWWYQRVGNEIHVIDHISESGGDPSYFASIILGKCVQVDLINGEVAIHYLVNGVKSEYATLEDADPFPGAVHRQEYEYQSHFLPHDAKAKRFEAHGKSVRDQLQEALGWGKVEINRILGKEDGIMAVRAAFPNIWIDKEKCFDGIRALRSYRREPMADDKSLKRDPKHDWASHSSDAFKEMVASLARAVAESVEKKVDRFHDYDMDYDDEEFNWKVAL